MSLTFTNMYIYWSIFLILKEIFGLQLQTDMWPGIEQMESSDIWLFVLKVKTSCFHLTKAPIIGAICCFLLYHGTQNVQDSHTPFFWCINFILISYLYNKVPTIQFICWVTKHLCLMRMNSPQTKQNTPGLFKHFLLAGILELMNQHYSISLHTSAVW